MRNRLLRLVLMHTIVLFLNIELGHSPLQLDLLVA